MTMGYSNFFISVIKTNSVIVIIIIIVIVVLVDFATSATAVSGKDGVRNKVLYGEAPPGGSNTYALI